MCGAVLLEKGGGDVLLLDGIRGHRQSVNFPSNNTGLCELCCRMGFLCLNSWVDIPFCVFFNGSHLDVRKILLRIVGGTVFATRSAILGRSPGSGLQSIVHPINFSPFRAFTNTHPDWSQQKLPASIAKIGSNIRSGSCVI